MKNGFFSKSGKVPPHMLFTKHTCWILGAGASFDCISEGIECVPLTRNLLIGRKEEPRYPIDLEYKSFVETKSIISKLISVNKLSNYRIEELLGPRLETTIDRIRELCYDQSQEISDLAKHCLSDITDAVAHAVSFGQVPAVLGNPGPSFCADNYLTLVALCAMNPEWSMLSLNYDCVLDMAFSLGLEPRAPQYDNYERVMNAFYNNQAVPKLTHSLFLKLHGSLDQYSCQNPLCEAYRRPSCINMFKKQRLQFDLEPRSPVCDYCSRELLQLILPPGRNKTPKESEYHNMLYSQSEVILANADTWILLGYSCPDYDKDIISLLSKAIKRKPQNSLDMRVIVISPGAKGIADRLSVYLDQPIVCIEETFSTIVDKLLEEINVARPSN